MNDDREHVTPSAWKAIVRPAFLSLAWACTLLAHPLSRADAVADWNRIALHTMAQSAERPERRLNTMATLNVAMFEALNFVRGRYHPRFAVGSRGMDGLSLDAVAAAAAHHVLVSAYPDREAALDAALGAFMDALPGDHGRASGAIAGASIAAIVRAGTSTDEGTSEFASIKPWLPAASWSLEAKVAQAVPFGPRADPLGWSPIVTELIAARFPALDESARIHALTSIVAAEAYFIALDTPERCAPCIAAAAVAHILAAEVGEGGSGSTAPDADREIGRALARSTLNEYYRLRARP